MPSNDSKNRESNTVVISARIPREDYLRVQMYANKKRITINDWLKPIIMRALYPGKKQP